MLEGNTELKLHQFMMGKGKTSVFTPLLSYCCMFKCNMQPTIITSSHLVKATKEYMNFIEYISNTNVNVFSDFEAKHRWLNNTDNTLQSLKQSTDINISNEKNIIDEFDSHHNYLQSMFNIIDEENDNLTQEHFLSVFDFVQKRYINSSYTPSKTLFNKHMIAYYNSINNLIFTCNCFCKTTSVFKIS